MKAHEITEQAGRTTKIRRLGRGTATGHGKTAGRGTKGQKARTGGKVPMYFEGGQTPLIRRLPKKRGFKAPKREQVFLINLMHIEKFLKDGKLTLAHLKETGYLQDGELVKILGEGDIANPIQVETNLISASARKKIEASGGSVTVIE